MEKTVLNSNPDLVEDDFDSDLIDAFYELDKKMSSHSDEPVSSSEINMGDQNDNDVKPLSSQIKRRTKSKKDNRASDVISNDNTLDGAGAIKVGVFISPETYLKLSLIKGLTKKSFTKIIGHGIDLVYAEEAENNSEFRKYFSK